MTPTLVVVSGPGGSGKTTLARRLARAVGWPVISRDDIKQGMAHAVPGFVPAVGDRLTQRTLCTFFVLLNLLVRDGVSLVAEAAFQDKVWRPRLEPLADVADLRIIVCAAPPEVAAARMQQRLTQSHRDVHADAQYLQSRAIEGYVAPCLPVPTQRVTTTDGYEPSFAELVQFVTQRPSTTAVPVLQGDGVVLDGHTDADIAAHVAGEDEETAHRLGWWPQASTEHTVKAAYVEWAQQWRTGGSKRVFAVRPCVGGPLVGGCDLRLQEDGTGQVSWWTHASERNQGYATRAVNLLAQYAASIGLQRIEAHVAHGNIASRTAAETSGFHLTRNYTDELEVPMVVYERHLA